MSDMDTRFIKRKRTIGYFVEAAREIEESDGIEAITIRNVAKKAGYNSATLYNYFENLDHLLFYASMEYIGIYISNLRNRIRGIEDPLEKYIELSRCFYEHAYNHAKNFYYVFMAKLDKDINLYTKEYYEFFPLELDEHDSYIKKMVEETDLFQRSHILIKECIDARYFTEKDGIELNDIMIYVFESFLYRVMENKIDKDAALINTMEYLMSMIGKYRI